MRNIYALGKRFISIIKQEGVSMASKVVFRFFTDKYSRLKYSLLVRYYNTFRRGLILKKIQGNKMYLNTSDIGLSRDLLLNGIREPLQTETVKKLVKPGMIIADIGANIGYYVLIEAAIVGETGKVYAIEPIPQSYEILKKNVLKNKYEHIVETYQYAASDICGTFKMAQTTARNFSTMFLDESKMSVWMKRQLEISTEIIIEVETVTVDEFFKDKEPMNFIRMDVEGYERKIIKGMFNTVRNSGDGVKVFIEMHPSVFADPPSMIAEIMRDLADMGLKVEYIVNTEGTRFLDFTPENIMEILCSEWAPGVFLGKT